MNGFTVIALVLSGVSTIVLWCVGLVWTVGWVDIKFNYSTEKTVAVALTAYLAATIVILFGIGACV